MQPAPPSTPPPQKRTPAPPPQPPPADAQRPASQDGSTAGDNTTAQQAPRPPPGSKPSTAAADQTQRTTAPRTAAAYESNSSGVTASRLPVGGALALARRASEVQQDVEFFQQVAQELPDCPALQSLLYTHRNVIGDGPTCDELLASVESRLAEWNATRRECIATERAAAESLKKARLQEAEAAEANRQREIEATIARMQSCFNEVSAIDQHQRQRDVDSIARERQALEARHAEERKAVEQYCQTLDRFEAERKRRIMEIDHADARGAVETQETLQRSLKLSEEEHARIDVAHRFADARERVRLVEEALDGRVVVLRHEEAAVVDLRAWFEHLAQRCNHQTQLRKLKQALLDQCSDNEHAARAVLRVDEERDFESIYVASIEVGVSSPSRRRQQQQQQQAESPTHV